MHWQAELHSWGSAGLCSANRLLAPLDRFAQKKCYDDQPVQAIFITGMPRSGTTLAYELIVQAFNVAFLTRAYSYTYGLPNITSRLIQRFTHAPIARFDSTYGRIPGLFSPAENHTLWQRWFRSSEELGHFVPSSRFRADEIASARSMLESITAIAGRPFVFKDVYLAMSPNALLDLYPGARIIVVDRDFESVCASVYRGRLKMRNRRWWSIRPPFYDRMIGKEPVEQTAFQCVRTRQLMDREYARVSASRCITISYEEICDAPRNLVDRLAAWAGPVLRRRGNARVPAFFDRRGSESLPVQDVPRFERLCEALKKDRNDYLVETDRQVQQLLQRKAA